MSYDFSFVQFPTKEFLKIWEDFLKEKMGERIDEKIKALEGKTYITKFPSGT
jgi:hypothetical protein